MKFQCDRCKTRYSIGEEKIRGKVLKIRCKNCSAVITVREGQSSTAGAGAAETKGGSKAGKAAAKAADTNGKKAAASPVLEDAFNRAMSRLPTPDPAKDLREDDSDDADAASTPSPGVAGLDTSDASRDDSAPPLEIEWFVSIDGEQEGPFSLAQAQRRVGKKQPQEEMFAWQEGFDDWLPIEKVPELAGHVPVPAPARKQRASAPPIPGEAPAAMAGRAGAGLAAAAKGGAAAAKAAKPAPAEEPLSLSALAKQQQVQEEPESTTGGDFDFDIGEASRVVKLPMLVPPPRAGDAAPVARAGLPGITGSNKAARGTGGQPIVAGGIVGDDVNLSAAVLQPQKRNQHGLVFWVGGGAMVAILGVLLVILLKGGDSSGAVSESDNPTSAFVEGFYQDENNIGYIPGLPLPQKETSAREGDSVRKPSTRKPLVKTPIIGTTDPNVRKPVIEDFSEPAGSVGERDAEEVLEAQKRYGAGLKWCFERALKTNPDLKGRSNRYDVQITITAAGSVRSASVAGADRDLKECVRGKVASWGFRPARGDFTTQFPIVFN